MRNSLRSSWLALLVLVVAAGGTATAHRIDEYLQAARLGIEPDRVTIELDLTPGIAVAEEVLREIDSNGNRSIEAAEGRAYAARVLAAIAVDVDGMALRVELAEHTSPATDAVLNGDGTLRVLARATLPGLAPGTHRLRYRNTHRPDIGVYLSNALVPSSERISVAAQRRNIDQRDLTIEYELRPDRTARIAGGLTAAIAAVAIWLTVLRQRRVASSATAL